MNRILLRIEIFRFKFDDRNMNWIFNYKYMQLIDTYEIIT